MKTKSSDKYVIFSLDKTLFGIYILKSREIVSYGKITPVPESPDFIKGVINLRGTAIPVVDLLKKFFNINCEERQEKSIIITELFQGNEISLIGLIVDNVIDVVDLLQEKLDHPPKYGSKIKAEYISNVATYNEEFVLILNIEKIMSSEKVEENIKDINRTNKK